MTNVPLYRTVYNELLSRIHGEIYPRGAALPSEPKLRDEFGVSLITVRRAIHELVLDGLVDSRQGIGNIVRNPAETPVAVQMSSFTSDVAAGQLRIVRTLMEDRLISASGDIADRLGVQPGSTVRYLMRLDCEGGTPLSLDLVYIPPYAAGDVTTEIAASPLFMHLWQEASKMALVRTQYEIGVEKATDRDQELLQIGPDIPVLVTWELIYDSANRRAAWIISRYRGDRARLSATVTLVQSETEHGIIGE